MHLTDDQPADDRHRSSGCRSSDPVPLLQHERQRAEQGRHRGHQGSAGSAAGRFLDGSPLPWRLTMIALGGQREVDHHNGVLLDDADQQNDADDRNDIDVVAPGDPQRHQRTVVAPAEGNVDMMVIGWMKLGIQHAQLLATVTTAASTSSSTCSTATPPAPGQHPGTRSRKLFRQMDVLFRLANRVTAASSDEPAAVSNEIVVAGKPSEDGLICNGPGFCSIRTIERERTPVE